MTAPAERKVGERVIVRGQYPGEAFESVGIGPVARRWVQLDSGNSGWFLHRDLEPAAPKVWPPVLETKFA